jgi:CRISPR-associated helicase Cas3
MSDTSKRKQIKLESVSFRFADEQPELAGDLKLFPHQKEFFHSLNRTLDEKESRFLFLKSMTGSGKTIANIMPAINKGLNILITYPTNQLIEDQKKSIEEDAKKKEFDFEDEVEVEFLNARKLQRERHRRDTNIPDLIEEKINSAKQDDSTAYIFLTSPDTLYNILAGKYWMAEDFTNPMDRAHEAVIGALDYFVFDEFHMYNISSETSILNMSLLLHHNTALSKPIVFSSATSDEDFKEKLITISKNDIVEIDDSQSRVENGEKTIAGEIDLEIILGKKWKGPSKFLEEREKDILDIKKGEASDITAIFESVKNTTNLINQITRDFGLSESEDEIAYKTGIDSSEGDLQEGDLKLGTQTISVGIDFDTSDLFFESYRARDFLQKLGRVGRNGEKSKATCYTSEFSIPGLEELNSEYKDRYQFHQDLIGDNGEEGAMETRNKMWRYPQKYGFIELGNFKKAFALNLETEVWEISQKIYHRSPRAQKRYRQFIQHFRNPGTPQIAVATENNIFFQELIRFLEQHSFRRNQHEKSLVLDKDNFLKNHGDKNKVNAQYIEKGTIRPVLLYDKSNGNLDREMHPSPKFKINGDLKTGLRIYPNDIESKITISSADHDEKSLPKQLQKGIRARMGEGEYLLYVVEEETYQENRGLIPHLFRTYELESADGQDYRVAFGQNALKLDATMEG